MCDNIGLNDIIFTKTLHTFNALDNCIQNIHICIVKFMLIFLGCGSIGLCCHIVFNPCSVVKCFSILVWQLSRYSRGTKAAKMLTLAQKGIQLNFVWLQGYFYDVFETTV